MSIKISKNDEEIIKFFFSDKVKEFQIKRICDILKIYKDKKTLKIINDIVIQHNKDLFRKYFKLKPKNISLNDYLKRLSLKTIYDCIPIVNQYIKQNQIKRYNDFNNEEFAAFGKNDAFISASGERYNQMPNIDMTERPMLNTNLNNKYGDVNEKFNQLQNSYQQQLTNLNAPPQNRTFTNSYNPQQLQVNPQQQFNQLLPLNNQMPNLSPEQLKQMAQNPEFIKNMFADKNYTPAHQDNQPQINLQSQPNQPNNQQFNQSFNNISSQQEQQTQDTINQLFAGLISTDILNNNGLEGTDLNTVYNQTLISDEDKQKFNNNQINIDAALNKLQSERNQLDNFKPPPQSNNQSNQSFFEQQGLKGALNKEKSLNDDDIYNTILEQPTNIFNILKNVYNKSLFIINKDKQKININDISNINDFNLFNSILHNKNLFLTQISPITLSQINNALNYFNPSIINNDDDVMISSSDDDEDNNSININDNDINENNINIDIQNNINDKNLKKNNKIKNKNIKKENKKQKQKEKEKSKPKEILLKISSKKFNEDIKKSNHFTIKFNNKDIIKKLSIKNIYFKNKIINEDLDLNNLSNINVYNNNFNLNFNIENNLDINNIINEINNNKDNEFIGLELNEDKTIKIFSFDEQNFIINNHNNSIFKLLGFTKSIYKDNNAYISEKSINLNDLSDTNTNDLSEHIINPIIILTINNKKYKFKDLNNKDIPFNDIIYSLTFDIFDENKNYYDMIDYFNFDLSLFI